MSTLFDGKYMFSCIPKILEALPLTLYMLLLVMIIGLLLGFLLAALRLCKNKIGNAVAAVYVSFARGTPELVQLFLIYYMVPGILDGLGIDTSDWSKVVFAVIAFSMSNAAYLSETLRSAYLAVPKGQHEAAASIGMTGMQAFRRVVLPQAVAVALPNVGNSIVIMFKTLSIGFSIGVTEILGKTKLISAAGFGAKNLECYVAAAIIYCVVCFIMERTLHFFERMFQRGKKQYA